MNSEQISDLKVRIYDNTAIATYTDTYDGVVRGEPHEILRRLPIQVGARLVADHDRLFPTALAHALLRRAGQNPFYTRKVRRQFLPRFVFVEGSRRYARSASAPAALLLAAAE